MTTEEAKPELWVSPLAHRLDIAKFGVFVNLSDGSLLTIDGREACVSRDDGRSWETHCLFEGQDEARWEFGLLRTAEGVIVMVYMDKSTAKWGWDNDLHAPIPDAGLQVKSMYSLDEGRTWSKPELLYDGWCGAIINMMQTREGRIIVPIQRLLFDPGRHAQVTYSSDDEGRTWRRSNIIDFGGHGHHDGICEGTLVELLDGRIWMLLRTTLGRFWQAFSDDQGLTWRTLLPTDIDSSSAPAYVTRLASGRLVMAWNREFPEGLSDKEKAEYPFRGGDRNLCERACSWHRGEIAISFSEDDGKTWTAPHVLVRLPGGSVCYPFILEREPGLLWVTTRFGLRTAVSLGEEEFVGGA